MITDEFIDSMARRCVTSDAELDALIRSGGPKRIQTVNLHHLALASENPSFAKLIDEADAITADGWPIVKLMRSRRLAVERVTGSEFAERLVDDQRLFVGMKAGILGGSRDVGFSYRSKLHGAGLEVVWREHGDRSDWKPKRLVKQMRKYGVELLIVAVTPPYGESIGQKIHDAGFEGVIMNTGGAMNMVVGAQRMTPGWARSLRLEWLYRLLQEPRRLYRRYVVECMPVFVRYVLPSYFRRE